MTETHWQNSMKVPEFLRQPLEAAQARFGVIGRLTELSDQLEKLRETGRERAQEWRERVEGLQIEILERMVEMQDKVLKFLGVATREQVEELSLELERLSKKLEKGEKEHRRRGSRKASNPADPETLG